VPASTLHVAKAQLMLHHLSPLRDQIQQALPDYTSHAATRSGSSEPAVMHFLQDSVTE